MPDVRSFRRQLVDYGKHLYNSGFVGATEGNISVRLNRASVLITPSGKNKGRLKPSDMVVISLKGKKLSGKHAPSSEYRLHLMVYNQRPDIKAIVHAHPIYATAHAVAGLALDKLILPEIIGTFGIIPLVDYGTPGTLELTEKIADFIGNHDALVLKNHGAMTLGKSLEDAFNKMELVERYARILTIAKQLGKPWEIPIKLAKKIPGYERTGR